MLFTHTSWILLWIPTKEFEQSESHRHVHFERMVEVPGDPEHSANIEDIPLEELVDRAIKALGVERLTVDESKDGNFKLFQFCVKDEVKMAYFIC